MTCPHCKKPTSDGVHTCSPQERNAWNCPHCAPRICSCEWRHSEPECAEDKPERCPNTGDLFGGEHG